MSTAKRKVELEGSIEEFGLSDIVQFLSGSEKTGKLYMVDPAAGSEGVVSFVKGSVVHAEAGDAIGEDAFFELVVWNEGQFTFDLRQLVTVRYQDNPVPVIRGDLQQITEQTA